MSTPRVSIGLPVYNGEKYLWAALDCILRQDFADFELVICDNASTDATEAICREYAARDGRIRYTRNETNIGASGNYKRVFELSRGEFFKWASHDDEFDPSLVRRCVETFAKSPATVVLVYSRAEIIDEAGAVTDVSADTVDQFAAKPHRRLASLIMNRQYANPLWGLIRVDVLRKTRLMGNFEADHILLAELAMLGNFVELPELLYRQRRHAGSAMRLNLTARQLLAWHDPGSAKKKIILPRWLHLVLESFRGVRHVPISGWEKLLCHGAVLWAPFWRWLLQWTGPVRHRLGLRRRKARPFGDRDAVPRAGGSNHSTS